MRRFLYRPLRLLDWLLQLIVPVRRSRVCYTSSPDYTDNAYFMYRHILETRDNIEHVWLINKDSALVPRVQAEFSRDTARAGTWGHTLRIARKYSLAGYLLYLSSGYSFHTHGGYPFSTAAIRRKNVSLWHGMPIKCVGALNKISPNPFRTFGGLHVATSHFFKYIIAAAFSTEPDKVLVCSLPRCDALQFPGVLAASRASVRARLGIADTRRLVLWMPTYRTEAHPQNIGRIKVRTFLDDLPPWVLPELGRACEANACTLLLKLHPGDLLNHMDAPFEAKHIHILKAKDWLKQEIQLYDLIAASDALISDVSSVLIDYLVTERPIGILGFDAATYTRDLTFPMRYVLESERFDVLGDAHALQNFFSIVATGAARPRAANDNAGVLYDSFEERGAEAVLRAVKFAASVRRESGIGNEQSSST